jgi:4-diphosphocytidyl-2-C-methyl-D-erythritol kinase
MLSILRFSYFCCMISFPNAKINIGLRITGKRPDGYHDLETVFFPVGWSDALEIASSKELSFSSSGLEIDAPSESNLVMKAYRLLSNDFNLPPLRIHLHKQIPFGAGLGGGSADGAFMLRMLNKTFNLDISQEKMIEYAAQLGSDCPFFLVNRPVFATGRGEVMSAIDVSLKGLSLFMVKPVIEVSTANAFRHVVPQQADISLRDLIQLPVTEWRRNIFNQFETSVFLQYPEIEAIKNQFYRLGAIYASMSGSGSCVFGLFVELPEKIRQFFPPIYQVFSQQI